MRAPMKRTRAAITAAAIGLIAMVVAYVFIPAAQGRPLVGAAILGLSGLLAVAAALGAALPRRVRTALGWAVLACCPIVLLVWVAFVGIPAGTGAIVLGGALAATAIAGLVIAVREVRV
jgi:hypothetical protein